MKRSPRNPREADSLFGPVADSVRQVGSHRTYKMGDGQIVTIVQHAGEFGPDARRKIYRLAIYYGLLVLVGLFVITRLIS